jgi:hypothetical protein
MKAKKTLEEMTDRELMAHTMAVKRKFSKKLNSFATIEEEVAWFKVQASRIEAEWGIKFATPPPLRP